MKRQERWVYIESQMRKSQEWAGSFQNRENRTREVLGGGLGVLRFAEGMGSGGEDRDHGINPVSHTAGFGGHPQPPPLGVAGTWRIPGAEPRPRPSENEGW